MVCLDLKSEGFKIDEIKENQSQSPSSKDEQHSSKSRSNDWDKEELHKGKSRNKEDSKTDLKVGDNSSNRSSTESRGDLKPKDSNKPSPVKSSEYFPPGNSKNKPKTDLRDRLNLIHNKEELSKPAKKENTIGMVGNKSPSL